ncbi:MAG: lamin tail domain-containing protein [Promethearchaeota archaeon]
MQKKLKIILFYLLLIVFCSIFFTFCHIRINSWKNVDLTFGYPEGIVTDTTVSESSGDLPYKFCTTIVINEIFADRPDWIEMYNYGPDRNMTGWHLEIFDDNNLTLIYNFPNDWVFHSHYVVVLHETSTDLDTKTNLYTEDNIVWYDRPIAIGLFDDKGVNVDWFQTSTHTANVSSDVDWEQDVSLVVNRNYAYRTHDIDKNKASDWNVSGSGSQGNLNPGQLGEGYPSFHNLVESEDPLELGNTEIINVNIYDLTGISQVQIEIEGNTYPMIKIDNFTWQYDSWTPSSTGNKPYTIYAENLLNNINTINDSIEVIDIILPSYSNLTESADPLELGSTEIIDIDVYDISGINQVLIVIEGINYTMTNIGGDTWQYDSWTPPVTGTYSYTIYMEDMNENLNSVTESILVVDTTPPSYSDLTESADPLELGDTEIISINVYDESGISQVLIEIEGANYTMTNIGGDTWQYDEWIPSTTGTYFYSIYMGDLNNNWNSITNSIIVIGTNPPSYSDLFESADPLELGDTEIISINVYDESGINQVLIEIEGANYTMTNIGGDTWQYDTWIPLSIGIYFYTVYMEDIDGNWNLTSDSIKVVDTTPPQIIIYEPNPYDQFGINPPDVDIEFVDYNLDAKWYQLSDGTKSSNYTWFGSIDQNAWDLFGNGLITITFYANDSVGNLGFVSVKVKKDITAPDITINEPNPYDLFGTTPPYVDIDIEDPNLDTIWYEIFNLTESIINYTWIGYIEQSSWDKFHSGILTIRFYANDTLGNRRFLDVTIIKDITPPEIIINRPNFYNLFGAIPPSMDISIFDDSLDDVWYQLTDGIITTTNYTWIGSISQDVWDELGNGTIDIIFYANDTLSNFVTQFITVRKDIIAPLIFIDYPLNYSVFGIEPPEIIINIEEPNLDKIWYQIDNGTIITNHYLWTGIIERGVWDEVGNGTLTILFYANDTIGNWDSNILIIRKDVKAPKITIEKPEPNNLFGKSPPIINVDFSDPHLSHIWYQLKNESITTINHTWTGIIEQSIWNLFGNGSILINFYANDSLGNLAIESLLIYKDVIAPNIIINYPKPNDVFGKTAPDINIIFEEKNLNNTWYQLKNGTLTTQNYTWTGVLEQSVWDKIGNGTVIIIFYADDLTGNLGYLEITVLKDLSAPIINIIEPEESVIFGTLPPEFKVYISGVDIHSCWYNLLENKHFFTKTDGLTIISIDQTKWDEFSNGTIIIEFYVNDSVGNIGFDIIKLRKDIFAPEVRINLPIYEGYLNEPPILNISFFDPNYDTLWYRIGINNVILINNTEQKIDLLIWDNLEQGEFQIHIFANDSAGNINNTYSFRLFKDTLAPLIKINFPINNSFSNIPPILNITCFDPNFNTLWYGDGNVNVSLTNNTNQSLDWEIWNNLPDGIYELFIYANDTFDHLNDLYILTLYKDTNAPKITIYSPTNNTLYNQPPFLDIYAIEPNLHTLWYEIGEFTGILQNHIGQEIDEAAWNNLPQGEFQLYIYANDSFGYLNNSLTLILYKDTLAPRIIINLPLNQTYWDSRPRINITVYDPNLDKIWYKIGTVNSSLENNTETLISESIWSNLPEEQFIIEIFAIDYLGQINKTGKLILYKDTLPPEIRINYPYQSSFSGLQAPFYNLSINEANLDKAWYTLVGYPEDYILLESTGVINQTAWDNFGNGTVIIRFYANDTLGKIRMKEVNIRKDVYVPIVEINLPINQTIWDSPPIINISVFDPNLDNIWYKVGIMYSSLNNNIEQLLNNFIWFNLPEGEFRIYFYANDSAGNINDSYYLALYKDSLAPNITINLPIQNQEVRETAPQYDLIIIEDNLATRWYTLDGGLTNITFIANVGQVDQQIWNEIWESNADGNLITIRFYANDTLNHLGYQDVIIKVKKSFNSFKLPRIFIVVGTSGCVIGITTIIKKTSKKYKRIEQKQKKKIDALIYLSLLLISLTLLTSSI